MESRSTQPKRSRTRVSRGGASFIYSSSAISKSDVSKIIDQVKYKIESSLKFYMTTEQIMQRLEREGIPRWLTLEVWKALREQNSDFFVAYGVRLKLIEQITKFNELLEHQQKLMMANAAQPSFPIAPDHHAIHPMSNMFEDAANHFDVGFFLPQKNSMPFAEHPNLEPIGSGLSSSYNGFYGIPATNNVYHNIMNYLNGAAQATILDMAPVHVHVPNITMDAAPMTSTGSFPANPSGVPTIHASRNQAAMHNQAYAHELHPRTVGGPENSMATDMSFGELPENLTITDLQGLIDD
uniref:Uncharacterized protein LOC105042536 n=2 Tax=Elaeis guineensis var. tenera TaxID=51953 RepID=A0A6I9R1M8_ELAGV|nr:uncharacterized protein LOC105042536 [Elaeis guineensis]XP_029120170.1 uncharacterized protein LOC105042536 [Elaeis guineensis]